MKVISKLLLVFAAIAVVSAESADFDRDLWEEVPVAMVNLGVGAVRRNLASEVTAANGARLSKRAKWMYNNHVATWYAGQDLQNPYCYQSSSPRIRDDMRIGAIKDKKKCFWCVKVSLTKAHPRRSDLVLRSTTKQTTIKLIDYCPTCDQKGEKVNSSHLDLSKGAFKDLGKIVDGELPISWKRVNCYKSSKWPLTPGKKY
jgi:expansin (peptidoglycan-binding protein)